MKAVLISIKPKWCDLIRRGRKMVEVRKTCPKLEVPFKVYIYEMAVVGAALFSVSSPAPALMCSGRSVRASASSASRRCMKAA